MQEGRDAVKSFKEFQSITRELLAAMRARGEPDEDDGSIGALLMRIRDANGQPLSDEVLLPQIAVFFLAGFDTTGHTLAWTLCDPYTTSLKSPSGLKLSLLPYRFVPKAFEL